MKLEAITKISNMRKKSYIPDAITVIGVIGMLEGARIAAKMNKPLVLQSLYRITGNERYNIEYLQLTRSNNWLHMHGYPMRRKLRMKPRK